MIYIITGLSVVIIVISVLSFMTHIRQRKMVNFFKTNLIHSTRTIMELKNENLTQAIRQILCSMDSTHITYNDEDEANRELTTSLKVLGHHAVYHHPLLNGRTIDIFADDFALIEGKLDIDQAETDRLIGQIKDYLSEDHYHVFIVLYGRVKSSLLKRITEQLIDNYPERSTLIYLDNAKRIRGEENEVHEIHQIFNRRCRTSYSVDDRSM